MAFVENVDLCSIVAEGSPNSLVRPSHDALAVLAFIYEIASRSGCDIAAQAIRAIIKLSCRSKIILRASSRLFDLDFIGDMILNNTDLLQMAIRAHGDYRLQVVEFLIEKGAQVHSVPSEEDGRTMLHDALLGDCQGRREITEILLRHGADCQVDSSRPTILESSLQPDSNTFRFRNSQEPSDITPATESLEIFERLLKLGAPVRIQSQRLESSEWPPLLTLLIARGAKNDLIYQAIEAGVALDEEGGLSILRGISQSFHYPNIIGVCTPLIVAIDRKRFDLAVELLNRGSDINGRSRSPLFIACETEAPIWFLEFLIDKGADVNALRSKDRRTPLQAAAGAGLLNIAALLLSHGADINAVASEDLYYIRKSRALDLAAFMGRLDMVQFLLDAGGRSAIPGVTGVDSAVKVATGTGNFAIVSVLEKHACQHRDAILQAESI
ncbi:hypothetical protein VPNG_08673 [Cytospora leucostoma]|uniref:Uncharacterized protein n=1 Tax=Cytospora leucostoma TaxID=1230097 RepID=A0A423W3D9_9PEZI|nr:hypothetical protein VPNG_08673 [Cytospora leucostoma]